MDRWSSRTLLVFAAAAVVAPLAVAYRKEMCSSVLSLVGAGRGREVQQSGRQRRFTVLYATTTGTAKIFAHRILQALRQAGVENASIAVRDVKEVIFLTSI